jgi:hypothetical protein
VIILFTGVIFPDYLIPKVISDYLSIALREKLMITVAKHMIILVIIWYLTTPYAGPHKLFESFLKLPCCIFTVAERKQWKAVISFEEWNWKSCSAALQFRTPFANSPFYPSIRSSSPTYFTFISNSADGLVYPSTLSGEVLCDTLRLVWCVCVCPQWFPDITWERISNFVLLFGTIKYRSSSNFSVIR